MYFCDDTHVGITRSSQLFEKQLPHPASGVGWGPGISIDMRINRRHTNEQECFQ